MKSYSFSVDPTVAGSGINDADPENVCMEEMAKFAALCPEDSTVEASGSLE